MTAPLVVPMIRAESFDRPTRTLFHLRASDLSITPLTGQVASFTRNSVKAVRDSDGLLHFIGAHITPWHAYDLDGDGIFETPALLLEGTGQNVVKASQNLAAAIWSNTGTPTLISAAIALGDLTLDLLGDDNAAAVEGKFQALPSGTFGATGVKAWRVFVGRGPTPAAGGFRVFFRDFTAGADRGSGTVTFDAAGNPVVSNLVGQYLGFEKWGKAQPGNVQIFELFFTSNAITSTSNTHRIGVEAAATVAQTGNVYVGGFGVSGSEVFNSSYIKTPDTLTQSRVVDLLTYPAAWGEIPISVYARIASAPWMGVTTAWHISPCIFGYGSGSSRLTLSTSFGPPSTFVATVTSAGPGSGIARTIPLGATLEVLGQFRDLRSNPKARIDVNDGAGLSADSAANIAPITPGALGTTLNVGDDGAVLGSGLSTGLLELIIAAEPETLAVMRTMF